MTDLSKATREAARMAAFGVMYPMSGEPEGTGMGDYQRNFAGMVANAVLDAVVSQPGLDHVVCPECLEHGEAVSAVCGTSLDQVRIVGQLEEEVVGVERCVVCYAPGARICSLCHAVVYPPTPENLEGSRP